MRHGHVIQHPDLPLARCGGTHLCRDCQAEAVTLAALMSGVPTGTYLWDEGRLQCVIPDDGDIVVPDSDPRPEGD